MEIKLIKQIVIRQILNRTNNNKKNIIFLKIFFISILGFLLYFIYLYIIYYKIIRHPQDIFSSHKVFIESHKGVNREIFQNTLEAFERAIQYDIEAMETDIWITKDNVLIIAQASGPKGVLNNFYDHPGNIVDLTYEEISNFRTKRDNLKIPTLKELMELAKNKIFLNLEIKDKRVDLVFPYLIQLIEEYDFFDQISLSSFNLNYYYKIKKYNKKKNKNIIFGNIYGKSNDYNFNRKGNSLNIPWYHASKEICDKAHENGMAVLAYFKVNDKENVEIYKNLIQNGVDVICCNEPLLAKNFRDNYYIKNSINRIFFKLIILIKKYLKNF